MWEKQNKLFALVCRSQYWCKMLGKKKWNANHACIEKTRNKLCQHGQIKEKPVVLQCFALRSWAGHLTHRDKLLYTNTATLTPQCSRAYPGSEYRIDATQWKISATGTQDFLSLQQNEEIFSSLLPVHNFELPGPQLSSGIWLLIAKWQSWYLGW